MNFFIHTLGCKVNQYESEFIRRTLQDAGFTPIAKPADADIIIINSCTVTAESDRKTRQLVRRFRRASQGAVILLTGCMPQAFPSEAQKLPADIILGNDSSRDVLGALNRYLANREKLLEILPHPKGEAFEKCQINRFNERTRAAIKVEDGCDRGCTYCIIPKARGRVRSRPLEQITAEAEQLAKNGYVELVLVGINLSSFGKDCGLSLADAVDAAALPQGIKRVRLGSLEPDLTDETLLNRLAQNEKFCPQFHLALQSGDDATLKRMNRLYDTAYYRNTVQNIFKIFNNPSVTTDVMVGFAGETEQEFCNSLNFCAEMNFLKAHIFPYSVRTSTVAAGFKDQVPPTEKAARAHRMAAACDAASDRFLATQIGQTQEVLFETVCGEYVFGHSRNFCEVWVKGGKDLLHHIYKVRLTDRFQSGLLGELI